MVEQRILWSVVPSTLGNQLNSLQLPIVQFWRVLADALDSSSPREGRESDVSYLPPHFSN